MATQDEIRAKDVIPQLTDFRDNTDGFYGDGSQSSFFMKKDDLLRVTAQNALADNVAPEFVPNSTTTVAGWPYVHNGSIYVALETGYQGAWNSSKFTRASVADYMMALRNFTSSPILNGIIRELHFETPVNTSSNNTIKVYKNRVSGSGDYLVGLDIYIGADHYPAYIRSENQFTDDLFYIDVAGVAMVIDLSHVSGANTEFYAKLNTSANYIEASPYIYSRKVLTAEVNSNAENIAANTASIEEIDDCFGTVVNGDNVFDKDNPKKENMYCSDNKFISSNNARIVYVRCKPNMAYTLSVETGIYSRFTVFSCEDIPVNNGPCYIPAPTAITQDGRDYYTILTRENDSYVGVYYFNLNSIIEPEEDVLASIMITEGDRKIAYTPYSERKVIKESSLPDSVVASTEDDAFTSRTKSYGVVFNNSVSGSGATRVGDARGKNFNFAIGSNMAYGDVVNDFDNIYPWCDIRRCNISGGKVVAYEGDSSFKTDGTNGDVFVEIPKFYSYRSIIGDIETIVISGTKKAGFALEPAFAGNGNEEKEHIYVAAYATDFDGDSKAGNTPQTWKKFDDFYDDAGVKGYGVYDVAVLNAIQKLVLVENADKRVSDKYDGFGYAPYYNPNLTAAETATGVNTFEIRGGSALWNFRVGNNICYKSTSQTNDDIRKLLAITTPVWDSGLGEARAQITISGTPIDVVANETPIYAIQQDNGLCDQTMTYHTGRAGENGLSAERYRWMEGLWGNVWMQVGGLLVKDLEYYFTYDKSKYKSDIAEFEKVTDFVTPENNHYPSTAYGWLVSNGLVEGNNLLLLPKTIETDAQGYYSAKLYSCGTTDVDGHEVPAGTEFVCVGGGGWDHLDRNSPFTLRFWSTRTNGAYSHLYGSRYVIR